MRSLLRVIPLVGLVAAGPVRADIISLYSDTFSGVCARPSVPFQLNTVYVIHELSTGTVGSSWRIENTSGMQGLGSSCGQLSITGDVFSGISLNYGSCRSGTFAICQVDFFNTSPDPIPGCYQLRVLGYPGDTPLSVDCGGIDVPAGTGFFTFDIEGKPNCWDCATPVESTTWGRVKTLYR